MESENESTQDRIAQAFVSIAAFEGLDRATMRAVAKRAGLAVGSVQYYCRNHDGMLLMAFHHVMGRILSRGSGADGRDGTIGQAIRDFAVEFLPVDSARADEQRIYLAFVARAAVDPGLARVQHDYTGQLRDRCAAAFRLAGERGQSTGAYDPEIAAWSTVALIDGHIVHRLGAAAPLPAETATAILDDHLARFVDIDGQAQEDDSGR